MDRLEWDADARDTHWHLHSGEFYIRNEYRILDCEICCGVPPWDWVDNHVFVHPAWLGYVRLRLECGEEKPYGVSYTAFNWRKPRDYMFTSLPWFKCRECGRWRESANWAPSPDLDYLHYEYFKANSICGPCANAQKTAFESKNEESQYGEIIALIDKLGRTRGKR